MLALLAVLFAFAGGFGVGRIKNSEKLKAISTEISNLESKAKGVATVISTDVMAAVTYIKGKL